MAGCAPFSSAEAPLVRARKLCRLCMATDPGEIVNGACFDFDPDVVSYWSQWLGHPSPKLLVVGQDFSDRSYFEQHRGRDQPGNRTNLNLRRLLLCAGIAAADPPEPDTGAPVFLTNAILCLKQPPMARPIRARWVRACATNHLRPLVAALAPRVIVAMGSAGWRAVTIALELRDMPRSIGQAAGQSWLRPDGSHVFAVGHCGPLGLANRAWERQQEDWVRIGQVLGVTQLS